MKKDNEIKVGNVLMFYGIYDKYLGRLIRVYDNSPVTHCGVVYSVDGDNVVVAEAQSKGLTKVTYSIEGINNDKNLMWMKCNIKYDENKLKEFIDNNIGKPYGYMNYFMFFMNIISSGYVYEDGVNSMICSEAVARAFNYSSDITLFKFPEKVRPFNIFTSDYFKSK